MNTQEKIKEARYFAIEVHGGQKYDNFPYIKHLEDVHNILIRFNINDPALLISAFLHDSIEDSAASYNKILKKFGFDVAELVYAVTDELGRNRKERHEKTYPKIKGNLKAIILKLADRIANIEFGINDTEKSLFNMYKKEYSEFKNNLTEIPVTDIDGLKSKLDQMWYFLDCLITS